MVRCPPERTSIPVRMPSRLTCRPCLPLQITLVTRCRVTVPARSHTQVTTSLSCPPPFRPLSPNPRCSRSTRHLCQALHLQLAVATDISTSQAHSVTMFVAHLRLACQETTLTATARAQEQEDSSKIDQPDATLTKKPPQAPRPFDNNDDDSDRPLPGISANHVWLVPSTRPLAWGIPGLYRARYCDTGHG